MGKSTAQPTLPIHGATTLPSVEVISYNLEVEDDEGFIGDKANKGAFWDLIEKWRAPLREAGEDPFGKKPTEEISKKKLEEVLAKGTPEAAAVVQGAVEDFAQQLAKVIKRFLKLKAWRDVEAIAVGGGFRQSRVGELVIGRTGVLLKADSMDIAIEPIRHEPDQAGLLGAAHLLPGWILDGHEAILAVDVGGTNVRAGLVELNLKKSRDLSKAKVDHFEVRKHGDTNIKRDEAIDWIVEMLNGLIGAAEKEGIKLAPVVGVGCPGLVNEDGTIERGAQNLPGSWEGQKFNLPHRIREKIPMIGDHETLVVMHNDAVVQGLSQLPYMQDRECWAALTIGTGLGNVSFKNRK